MPRFYTDWPIKSDRLLARTLSNLRTLCTTCDNQSHREKGRTTRTGEREERIVIRGVNRYGEPLDPNHHWNTGTACEPVAATPRQKKPPPS